MLTIISLTFLPILFIIYLCLNRKHKEMVNHLLKKVFSWFMIRRRKNKLEDGDVRKEKLEETQQQKEQEIKTEVKKNIEEVKAE